MGKPDLFAKRTLATQTEPLTNGAASWKDAPEIRLEQVQSDGILVIHDPAHLKNLAAPWNLVGDSDEILVEYKMQGDHIDLLGVSRILLRRQAREVQRIERGKLTHAPWLGRQTIWIASAYMPKWANSRYRPNELAQGCHRWANEHFTGLWIAANELPLRDELIPFLITRTGRALEEFLPWVAERRPWPWVDDLLESLTMVPQGMRDFIWNSKPTDDPERRLRVLASLFQLSREWPELREELAKAAVAEMAEDGVLREARDAVVCILQLRKLEMRPEHLARINASTNLDTLHRWRAQAVIASSANEALESD